MNRHRVELHSLLIYRGKNSVPPTLHCTSIRDKLYEGYVPYTYIKGIQNTVYPHSFYIHTCANTHNHTRIHTHTHTAQEACSPEGAVRLQGLPIVAAGRVEFCRGGVWGTVCDESIVLTPWSEKNGQVVCRALGYSGALNPILQDR